MNRANLIMIKELFLAKYVRWVPNVNDMTSFGLWEACNFYGFAAERDRLRDRCGGLIRLNKEPMEVELKLIDWAIAKANE